MALCATLRWIATLTLGRGLPLLIVEELLVVVLPAHHPVTVVHSDEWRTFPYLLLGADHVHIISIFALETTIFMDDLVHRSLCSHMYAQMHEQRAL